MILTILTHSAAALAGSGATFLYLRNHQANAIAAANNLSKAVGDVEQLARESKAAEADIAKKL